MLIMICLTSASDRLTLASEEMHAYVASHEANLLCTDFVKGRLSGAYMHAHMHTHARKSKRTQ